MQARHITFSRQGTYRILRGNIACEDGWVRRKGLTKDCTQSVGLHILAAEKDNITGHPAAYSMLLAFFPQMTSTQTPLFTFTRRLTNLACILWSVKSMSKRATTSIAASLTRICTQFLRCCLLDDASDSKTSTDIQKELRCICRPQFAIHTGNGILFEMRLSASRTLHDGFDESRSQRRIVRRISLLLLDRVEVDGCIGLWNTNLLFVGMFLSILKIEKYAPRDEGESVGRYDPQQDIRVTCAYVSHVVKQLIGVYHITSCWTYLLL